MTGELPASSTNFGWAPPALRDRLRRDPLAVLKDRGIGLPAGLPPGVIEEVAKITFLLWQDGKLITRDQFAIDPSDEGLLFGKGIWESTKTVNGIPWLWPQHLDRMLKTAQLVGLNLTADRLPDTMQVSAFVRSLTNMEVVIRLNATAGFGGKPGTVWMTAQLPPQPYPSMKLQTVTLPVPKGQPYLVWKTFQYATRLHLGSHNLKPGMQSTLVIDEAGHILEAAHANIFLKFPEGWLTPAVDGGFLPGTVRQHLLSNAPLPIREAVIPVSRLAEATEIFLTNSNIGIVPVIQIDEREWAVGPDTTNLMKWLSPGGK